MLQEIRFLFPIKDEKSKEFFSTLNKIFKELPNSVVFDDSITIQATYPYNAFPRTVIKKSNNNKVGVQYHSNSAVDKEVNKILNSSFLSKKVDHKSIGQISISDFYDKIKGHIVRIDHTGINVPSSLTKEKWNILLKKLAKITTIYNYPTGEDWPFILPATKQEYKSDITNFQSGREPKFELVYDQYEPMPTFQIDIETNLIQKEVEELFPDPIGQSFKGLETFFRAVYIFSPYPNLSIRFDIRFKSNNGEDDWHTGKWLVEEGKRIAIKD